MPLKLFPPKAGRSKWYRVRGTFLGVRINRSTEVGNERDAQAVMARWKREVIAGTYCSPVQAKADELGQGEGTFLAAATAYMRAGFEGAFLACILAYDGPGAIASKMLTEIDQSTLDTLAHELYPKATGATRNRQVYTPVAAVMHRAGIERRFKRPKGWRSPKTTSWLRIEQLHALCAACLEIDQELDVFVQLLAFTGMRRGEALAIETSWINLQEAAIVLPKTKNTEPRRVHLTPGLVALLANFPRTQGSGKLFQYGETWYRARLKQAMRNAGLSFPRRQGGFHLLRHSWAMLMRRVGGLDTSALVATGAWKDEASVRRYEHLDETEEAAKADLLPMPRRRG